MRLRPMFGFLVALSMLSGQGAQAAPLVPAIASAPTGKLAPNQAIPSEALAAFVDGAVTDAMAVDHISGVSVAVVQDGRVVMLKGYGVTGPGPGKAVDPERTLFRIASISKTFTWIALMQEVERGRIDLNAPVNDYLPPELKIPDQGFREPIRIKHLMSHSAGFEDSAFGHLFVDKGERVTALHDYLAAHRPKRVREPGKLATYSNYGAGLAGYIVARLEGADYQTVIERNVLAPLGMTSTTFREPYAARAGLPAPMPQDLAARVSTGFLWKGGEFRPASFEYVNQVAPGGGGSTTAADMARYMLMQLNDGGLPGGGQLYGPLAAKAFRTPILDVPPDVNGWAHGLMVRPLPGGFQSYGHGGSLISFYSNMVVVPDLKLGIFVTTNTDTGKPFTERLPKALVQRFYASDDASRLPGDPSLAKTAKLYAGAYVPTRRHYGGLEGFINLLTNDDGVSVTKSGYLITKVSGQTQAYVPDGAPGHFKAADGGQTLAFAMDAKGRARSFLFARGNATMERAGLVEDPGLFLKLTVLALVAALATVIGAFTRRGRDVRPTRWQAVANGVSLAASGLWLTAFGAFGLKLLSASSTDLMYRWPGGALLAASWSALAATVLTAVLVALTPLVLLKPKDGEGGWSLWRKLRHIVAVVVFVLFAALVGARGGLIPWN